MAFDFFSDLMNRKKLLEAEARAQKEMYLQQQQASQQQPYWTGIVCSTGASFDPQVIAKLEILEPRLVDSKVRITDSLSCIVGWRAWRTSLTAPVLGSVGYQEVFWPIKKPMKAMCWKLGPYPNDPARIDIRPHDAPEYSCECGMWAFKTKHALLDALESHQYGPLPVLGLVHLWGRVIETDHGFRAEKAYPKELWIVNRGMESLGRIYGVPVRTL